jgi:hypothetical protein
LTIKGSSTLQTLVDCAVAAVREIVFREDKELAILHAV